MTRTLVSIEPMTSCVVLVGGWRRAYIEQLGEYFDVRYDADDPVFEGTRVSWLLIGTGAEPRSVDGLVAAVRKHSPDMRLGVVVGEPGAPDPKHSDLRIPADAHPADVVAALHLACRGFSILEPTRGVRERNRHHLTERESELLDALCAGLGNDQIAHTMQISRRTVEFHLTRIFRKLGVASRVEAIVRAQP